MNIKSLIIITAAAALSATGCYSGVGDPTEDSEFAVVDENATDAEGTATDDALALTDSDSAVAESDENTDESEAALSTWHGYRGGLRRGIGRGYGRGYGRGHIGGFRGGYRGIGGYGADCFEPCYTDPCGEYGGYGGYGRW